MSCEECEVCVICLDDINYDDSIVVKLKCNHTFHVECILHYLSYKNDAYSYICPLCKNYIYKYDIDSMIHYLHKYTKNDYEKTIYELTKLRCNKSLFCIKNKLFKQSPDAKYVLKTYDEKIKNLLEIYEKKSNSFKLLKIIRANLE